MGLVRIWGSQLDPLKGIQAPGAYKTKLLGRFLEPRAPTWEYFIGEQNLKYSEIE